MSDTITIECRLQTCDDQKILIQKVTDDVMTPNEYVKVLAYRARILLIGKDKPRVPYKEPFNPIEIAKQELSERVIPVKIIRLIPDRESPTGFRNEEWFIEDMNIRDF